MTFKELERIAIGLFGQQWQKQLSDRLGVSKHCIQNWKSQGVAKWVDDKLYRVSEDRLVEVKIASDLAKNILRTGDQSD